MTTEDTQASLSADDPSEYGTASGMSPDDPSYYGMFTVGGNRKVHTAVKRTSAFGLKVLGRELALLPDTDRVPALLAVGTGMGMVVCERLHQQEQGWLNPGLSLRLERLGQKLDRKLSSELRRIRNITRARPDEDPDDKRPYGEATDTMVREEASEAMLKNLGLHILMDTHNLLFVGDPASVEDVLRKAMAELTDDGAFSDAAPRAALILAAAVRALVDANAHRSRDESYSQFSVISFLLNDERRWRVMESCTHPETVHWFGPDGQYDALPELNRDEYIAPIIRRLEHLGYSTYSQDTYLRGARPSAPGEMSTETAELIRTAAASWKRGDGLTQELRRVVWGAYTRAAREGASDEQIAAVADSTRQSVSRTLQRPPARTVPAVFAPERESGISDLQAGLAWARGALSDPAVAAIAAAAMPRAELEALFAAFAGEDEQNRDAAPEGGRS